MADDLFSDENIAAAAKDVAQETKAPAAAIITAPPATAPDEALKQVNTAKTLNVPMPVVQADPEGAHKEAQQKSTWDRVFGDWDMTRIYSAMQHSYGADVIGPDVDKWSATVDAFRKLRDDPFAGLRDLSVVKGVNEGVEYHNYANLATEYAQQKHAGASTADTLPLLKEYEKQHSNDAIEASKRSWLEWAGHGLGFFLGDMGTSAEAGAAGGAAAGAVLGGGVGAVPGAVAGGGLAVALNAGAEQFGTNYRSWELDDHMNTIPEEVRFYGAMTGGVVTSGLYLAGGKLTAGAFSNALQRMIGYPSVNAAIMAGVKQLGVAGLEGAAVNGGVSLFQNIIKSAVSSNLQLDKMYDTPEKRQALVHEVLQGAFTGALMMAGLRIPAIGVDAVADAMRASQSQRMRDFLDEVMKASEKMKAKQASPAATEQLLGSIQDNAPPVKVDPEGVPPGKVPPGADPDDVARARETGEKIEIPPAKYVANATAEDHAALKDHIAVGDGMTVTEEAALAEMNQKKEEQAKAAAEAAKAPSSFGAPSDARQDHKDTSWKTNELKDLTPEQQAIVGDKGVKFDPVTGRLVQISEDGRRTRYTKIPEKEGERVTRSFSGGEEGEVNNLPFKLTHIEDVDAVANPAKMQEAQAAKALEALKGRIAKVTPETHMFLPRGVLDTEAFQHLAPEAVPAAQYGPHQAVGLTHEEAASKLFDNVLKGKLSDEEADYLSEQNPEDFHGYMVPRDKAQAASAVGQARKQLYLNPLFKDGPSVGMTAADFSAYSKRILEQQTAMEKKVFEAEERRKKAEIKPDYKTDSARVMGIVEEQIKNLPKYQADAYFRRNELPATGKSPLKRAKLNRKTVDAYYPTKEASLARFGYNRPSLGLPKSYVKRGGMHPDELAPLFGYTSGQQMVEDLIDLNHERALSAETPAEHLKRVIREEHSRAMESLYGDPNTTAFNAALDAMLSEPQLDFLTSEASQLALQIGQRPISSEDIKTQATKIVESLPAVKLVTKLRGRERAVSDAGLRAEQALLRGDFAKAFQAKQQQALNLQLLRIERQAQRDAKELSRITNKYAKPTLPKRYDPKIATRIQQILTQYGIRPVGRESAEFETGLKQAPTLQKINDDMFKAGTPLDLPDWMLTGELPPRAGVWGFQDFNPMELAETKLAIRQLDTIARLRGGYVAGMERAAFESTMDRYVANMQTLPDRTPGRLESSVAPLSARTQKFLIEQLQPEQLIDWADLRDPLGPLNEAMLRGLKDGEDLRHDLMRDMKKRIAVLQKSLPSGWGRSLSTQVKNDTLMDWQTGQPRVMTRNDLIGIMLNMGSASNFDKLTGEFPVIPRNPNSTEPVGKTRLGTPDQVTKWVMENATKDDWKFVQGVWSLFDQLFPLSDAMYRRLRGVGVPKVESRFIDTRGTPGDVGVIKGGYYPIVKDGRYHRGVSKDHEVNEDQPVDHMFGQTFTAPVPSNSYTKARTADVVPLELNGNMGARLAGMITQEPRFIQEISKQIHDIAFREPLLRALAIIRDGRFRTQMDARFGPQYSHLFDGWLLRIANQRTLDPRYATGMAWWLGQARMRLVAVQMIGRASTFVKHTLGLVIRTALESHMQNAEGQVSLAAAQWFGPGGSKIQKFISDNSGFMRGREITWDRDLGAQGEHLMGSSGVVKALDYANAYGNYFLWKADNALASIQWWAMYKNSIAGGFAHEDAVHIANKSVRQTHGDGGLTSLPAAMAGDEFRKILTIAMQIFNENFNRIWNYGRMGKEGFHDLFNGNPLKGMATLWKSLVALTISTVGMGVGEELLSNAPQERENWPTYLMHAGWHGLTSSMYVVRDIERSIEGHDVSLPLWDEAKTFARAFEGLYKHAEGKKTPARLPRDIADSLGYLFKLPGADQAGITIQAIRDWETGKERPKTAGEIVRLLAAGKAQAPQRKAPRE